MMSVLTLVVVLTLLKVRAASCCASRQNDVDWENRLLQYIQDRDITQIQNIVRQGDKVNIRKVPEQGDYCWLHEAVEDSSLAVVRLLLDAGAPIDCNRYHDGGDTLLYYALFGFVRNKTEAVEKIQLLLEAGLDPNTPGLTGTTLLGYVLNTGWTWGTVEIVRALLDHGAQTNTSDPVFQSSISFGDSPLGFALDGKWKMEDEQINLEILKLLIAAGADLEERNCYNNVCGPTPLYFASVRSYLSVVNLLVESGANIWFKYTPYWLVEDMTPWYIWAGWEHDLLGYHLPKKNAKAYLLEVCRARLEEEGKGEEVEEKCRGNPPQD
eukprot:GFUD01036176.1.p1 GENE.GFUD01036176.1~~GFUD01036176.1.p1  ORF type:complete len:325 (-),score=80.87 GFUD01036176.1:122-1096(-)